MYRISFYVPESHLKEVKQAMFNAGGGKYKNYDQVCWQVAGIGQFRPLFGSQPTIGEIDKLEMIDEYKVEMVCEDDYLESVIMALIAVHPYEEPAYEFYKINQ